MQDKQVRRVRAVEMETTATTRLVGVGVIIGASPLFGFIAAVTIIFIKRLRLQAMTPPAAPATRNAAEHAATIALGDWIFPQSSEVRPLKPESSAPQYSETDRHKIVEIGADGSTRDLGAVRSP